MDQCRIVPSDALVFKFPSSLAWMELGSSLVCLGFVAFALALPRIHPVRASFAMELTTELLCVAIFGSLATFGLRSFRHLRDSVAANSDGIWYLPRKGAPTFIAWGDVASVNAHDTQQRMVLGDATGGRGIRLEYQLEDFGRLREFVLSHTDATAQLHASATNVFHRTWINKVILLSGTAFFLLLAWLSHDRGQPWQPLLFIGCAYLSLGAILQDPVSVEITREAVVVQYPGWKTTIPFDAISGIALKDVRNRGNVWAAVVIERRHGRAVRLFRFREGSVALHDTLQSAWQSVDGYRESVPAKQDSDAYERYSSDQRPVATSAFGETENRELRTGN